MAFTSEGWGQSRRKEKGKRGSWSLKIVKGRAVLATYRTYVCPSIWEMYFCDIRVTIEGRLLRQTYHFFIMYWGGPRLGVSLFRKV